MVIFIIYSESVCHGAETKFPHLRTLPVLIENRSESTDTYIVYDHARRFKNQTGILYTAIKGSHVFAMDRCTLIKNISLYSKRCKPE